MADTVLGCNTDQRNKHYPDLGLPCMYPAKQEAFKQNELNPNCISDKVVLQYGISY